MKRNLLRILTAAAACLVLLTLLLPRPSLADFGDYGGDSDYGGGWDSGSDWDSDYGGSDYYYYGGSSSDESSPGVLIVFGIIIVIVIITSMKNKNKKGGNRSNGPRPAGAARTASDRLKPVSEYTALDPAFSAADLSEKLSNLYVQMQNGWTAKDIEPLRPYFTDAFFTRMDRQLDAYRTGNKTNYIEKIAVLGADVRGWYQSDGLDHMIVEMSTRIVDYTMQDGTDTVLSGSRTAEKFMVYEYELVRETGRLTGSTAGVDKIICPSCGAPLDINASARCPYCDSVLEQKSGDWAIQNIKGISQTTNG